jgi:hypothetical protein
VLAGRPSRPADLQVCGRAGSEPDIQCASLGAGCQAIVRQSCLACKASVAQPQALKESDSLIMTFDDRAFLPSTSCLPLPAFHAFRPGLSFPLKMPSKKVRARQKQKNKSTGEIEPRFKTQSPSTVTTTEQGQAKQQQKIDGSFVGKLLYVCRPDPTQQSSYVRVYYELHAYHNLLLPKISARIQRYGFQVDPERVLEFYLGILQVTGDGFTSWKGPAFNNRPYGFGPLDIESELDQKFMRIDRDMVRSVLEVIFCEQDSCARNSDAIKIITLKPEISYNVFTAFRHVRLTFRAADSEPEDVYRITIRGTGLDALNQFKFEPSDLWMRLRFPTPVH